MDIKWNYGHERKEQIVTDKMVNRETNFKKPALRIFLRLASCNRNEESVPVFLHF